MWLIYFSVGADVEYAHVLEMCLKTLRENCADITQFDILVMCDTNYVQYVEYLGTKLHITPTNLDGVQSCMRKIEIFDVPNIDQYKAVLYLDCDIVICGDIVQLLSKVVDNNTLYTLEEFELDPHKTPFFGLENYTDDELKFLNDNCILAFNCGQFAFVPDEPMRQHFREVRQTVDTHTGSSFYEQSFMNRHFNLNCSQNTQVFRQLGILYPSNYISGKIVVHFTGTHKNGQTKLAEMQQYYEQYLASLPYSPISVYLVDTP